MKKLLIILACVILSSTGCSNSFKKETLQAVVVKMVIDCNTFELQDGKKVRIIGIDCPAEYTIAGRQAAAATRKMIEGKQVFLEFDVQKEDDFGKLLAYVLKPSSNADTGALGGTYVDRQLVQMGYVRPKVTPPNVKYANVIKKLYQEAQGR